MSLQPGSTAPPQYKVVSAPAQVRAQLPAQVGAQQLAPAMAPTLGGPLITQQAAPETVHRLQPQQLFNQDESVNVSQVYFLFHSQPEVIYASSGSHVHC